ncbi:hypothetical protein IBL26_15245 [Roseomonas aerophila]|uniref:Uncharacterized protein n=1 Tax=Teichococcus aerophilus TaxID=1224513 RepID=A0ABR7RPC9_9PROT|nr:hypothetical protein [Pseudoroseomonas aerophila]MBC9208198.1 hypothetical protein [Pseudoroseomonas aerophila]
MKREDIIALRPATADEQSLRAAVVHVQALLAAANATASEHPEAPEAASARLTADRLDALLHLMRLDLAGIEANAAVENLRCASVEHDPCLPAGMLQRKCLAALLNLASCLQAEQRRLGMLGLLLPL